MKHATGRAAEDVDHAVVQLLYSDDGGGWDDPRGNGGDPKWAIRALRRLARMGNGHSMDSLSLAYQRGAGVQRDWRAAERWARRAAKHGQSEVLNNIGVAYRHGEGVRHDVRRAVSCYRAAIAAGDIVALRNLSRCDEHGEGVRKDRAGGLRLIRKAARALHERAIEMLEELGLPLEPNVAAWWERERGPTRSRRGKSR